MNTSDSATGLNPVPRRSCGDCCRPAPPTTDGFARRQFLQRLGAAGLALGGLALLPRGIWAKTAGRVPGQEPFPQGAALRVRPVLVFDAPVRKEKTSWRGYGGIHTSQAADGEAGRIEKELRALKLKAEFPIEVKPVQVLDSQRGRFSLFTLLRAHPLCIHQDSTRGTRSPGAAGRRFSRNSPPSPPATGARSSS